MKDDERVVALRANIATYDNFDEREYVNSAPHLKHASIARIYEALADDAITATGREATDVKVLELGAGSGLASTPWFANRVQLTAVDSSETMLTSLAAKASGYGVKPDNVIADAADFLASTDAKFDVVTHVSMLHHVPDYLSLLRLSAACVGTGGCLLTFQDPIRYRSLQFRDRLIDRASYFAWRLGQGNFKRGLKTRWRRLRGVYSPAEVVDFDEYHVVREGVDGDAIVAQLRESFANVDLVTYWSTYSRPLQALGERLRLVSSFGILASGRKPS
jgi:SAM-dependent methyltransferase